MPPAQSPTYRRTTSDQGDTTFVCVVPDAGKDDGICGHESRDLELFVQHMHIRHAGVMVEEPTSEDQSAADEPSEQEPPSPGSSTTSEPEDVEV